MVKRKGDVYPAEGRIESKSLGADRYDACEQNTKLHLPAHCVALEVESVHLRHFVIAVFAGITEAGVEAASLLGEGPDQAFASGEGLGLAAENFVFEGQRSEIGRASCRERV